ncbi:MAG: cytochrome P450 [Pseudomonadales bacterium]
MPQSALDHIDVSNPDLYQADAWREPFARLRAEDPVHFHRDSPFGPYWSVTRHQDVMYVDKNHELFSSEPTIVIGDQPEDFAIDNFIQMDPPKHDEQRTAVMPVVAPRNLMKLEPVIRSRIGPILDALPVGETFDWVDRVSIELTTQMLATLFDFPFEQRRKLTRWSDMSTDGETVGASLFTEEERRDGLMDCLDTFMGLFRERAAKPPGDTLDLITMLAHSPATRDMPSRPMEFLGNIMLLIVGGNDTTRNTISGGVMALNENPEQYDKLRGNLALIPNMVSEMVRWQTAVLHMRRTATQNTELGGKQISKGEKVVMWYISANRDDSVMSEPDRLIIDRANARQHVAFGFGIHRCMGNRLAEMQLRIVWEEVMKRFRFVEVVGAPERLRSNFIRGITQLPVQVHPW